MGAGRKLRFKTVYQTMMDESTAYSDFQISGNLLLKFLVFKRVLKSL